MDKAKKEDVRIIKTRRDLRAALVKLLAEENFDKIGVSDICSEAMINRMTFYKHYSDKYDLLNDVLLNIKEDIIRRMKDAHPDVSLSGDALEFTFCLIETVMDVCLERRALVDSLDNNELVLTMISTTIGKSVIVLLKELDRKYPLRFPIEYLSVAVTGAASFLVRYWLKHNPEKTKAAITADAKRFFADLFASKIMLKQPE